MEAVTINLGISISERIGDEQDIRRRAMKNQTDNIRVAMPGQIVNFNPDKQTATVQLLIKELIGGKWIQLPELQDVPVCFPRAGGYCMTFPIKQGDECLLIFADMCIDSWWQSGGVQVQLENRRHDLSDAFALLGVTSVPKAVKGYSLNTVQLRNESGSAFMEISDDVININAKQINIIGDTNITGNVAVTRHIKAKEAYIDGVTVSAHKHEGVTAGGDLTGGPL